MCKSFPLPFLCFPLVKLCCYNQKATVPSGARNLPGSSLLTLSRFSPVLLAALFDLSTSEFKLVELLFPPPPLFPLSSRSFPETFIFRTRARASVALASRLTFSDKGELCAGPKCAAFAFPPMSYSNRAHAALASKLTIVNQELETFDDVHPAGWEWGRTWLCPRTRGDGCVSPFFEEVMDTIGWA